MSKPVLEVRDLKKYYSQKRELLKKELPPVKAVDGVSFTIDENSTLGLVGESGCGKSTLGKSLLHLTPPTAGDVLIDGVNISTLKSGELRSLRGKIQMIFQDPVSSLNPRMTIEEVLREPLTIHTKLPYQEQMSELYKLLDRVGMAKDALSKYPHQFSGGQCQRIAIARALTLKPKLIVADEPVSALDVSVQAQVLNLLKDLQDEYKLSYLFISHDLSVVNFIADRIAVMYLGEIVEIGDAKDIVKNPRHPYTKALISAISKLSPSATSEKRVILNGTVPSPATPPTGCRFHTRCPIAEERCRIESPSLEGNVRCHFI